MERLVSAEVAFQETVHHGCFLFIVPSSVVVVVIIVVVGGGGGGDFCHKVLQPIIFL